MNHHGRFESTESDAGGYVDRSSGHSRCVLFGRASGSVHQEAAIAELAVGGGVDTHLHAFEEALYVLAGELTVEIAGRTETLGPDDHLFVERGVSTGC